MTISITLHKYQDLVQVYHRNRNRFYTNFSSASRARLAKIGQNLGKHINRPDSDYYFWSN